MKTPNTSEGVYFAHESYAGFWQRLVVDVIDLTVIMAISVICTMVITELFMLSENLITFLFIFWAVIWFIYFVLLKRSKFGTLGYKLCNVRVVNLSGECPGIIALTLRLMFAAIGPLNFPLDLIWLSGDDNRQALRDKFARTYVIKKHAKPEGIGRLIYSNYDLWGWQLIFCEVKRPDIQKAR
jgi:uncharacterized RDD family membrane protein YckC